jgi:DnaJ family protein A protein 2
MVKDTTLYDRLEIPSDSNEAAIKKSFNRLSKLWHPDKHPEEKREEVGKKFQEINQAKEILLNDEKRKLYDNIGMDIFKNNMDSNEGPMGGDPFSMFGQGFPFGQGGFPGGFPFPGQGRGPSKGVEDIVQKLDVTLEQIYNEESVSVSYNYNSECAKCDGNGTKNGKESMCNTCGGKGMRVQVIRMGNMIQQAMSECNVCSGKGKSIDKGNECSDCNGKCFNVKNKSVTIPLKAGLTSGNKIQLSGKGHHMKNVKTDLVLVVNVLPHKVFKCYNNDLFITIELKLYQALFGFDKVIEHLDKRKLRISSSSNTNFNSFRKITGEGMKVIHSNTHGNMYIKFVVILPNLTSLPNETKLQLKSILQAFDKNEVIQEANITKDTGLVKTLLMDTNNMESLQLSELYDKLQKEVHNNQDNDSDNDMGQQGGQPGCVQQ